MAFKKDGSGSFSLKQDCIDSANRLIEKCKLSNFKVSCIKDINSSLIVNLFRRITNFNIPDLLSNGDPFVDVHNVQAVIDTLSLDLLGISLSHISGDNVVSGDPVAIINLLEILETVHLHLGKKHKSSSSSVSGPKRKIPTSSENLEADKQAIDPCPPAKIMKRKTCRRTLRKPCETTDTASSDVQSLTVKNIKKHNDILQESQFKVTLSENGRNVLTANVTKGIDKLYDENFENKVRALLLGKHSPQVHSQELKQNYLQSLKTPLKGKSMYSCKKSFLLPHNLRRQHVKQKSAKMKKEQNIVITLKEGQTSAENEPPAAIRKLLQEFPGFECPKNSLTLLTRRYYQHLLQMHKQLKKSLLKIPKTVIQNKEAAEQQTKLSNILAKDLREKNQLRAVKEDQAFERKIKCSLRDARLRSAKIKQYYEEFHRTMQKKLQQKNTLEELLVERTFKKMLDVQREKVQSICRQVKEADELDAVRHKQYLEALQNIYEQQMSVLSQIIEEEQKEAADHTKENNRVTREMTREWRDAIQSDVRSLQKDVLDIIRDNTHFREMDAQNFIDHIRHHNS